MEGEEGDRQRVADSVSFVSGHAVSSALRAQTGAMRRVCWGMGKHACNDSVALRGHECAVRDAGHLGGVRSPRDVQYMQGEDKPCFQTPCQLPW